MKKRIIGLILLVAILVSALVSCSYSISDEVNDYASYKDKNAFLEALKTITVDDSDFGNDPEARAGKLEDAIYALLGGKVSTSDKVKEGKVGVNDIIYFCYYVTVKGENPVKIAPTYMSVDKVISMQLGQAESSYKDTLQKEIAKLFENGLELGENDAYSSTVSGTAEAGKIAVISYKTEYKKVGEDAVIKDTVAAELVTLDSENPLHKKLLEFEVGKVNSFFIEIDDATSLVIDGVNVNKDLVAETEVEVKEGEETVKVNKKVVNFTEAKIEYVVSGKDFTIEPESTDESSIKKDIYGNDLNPKLKESDLVYHVYVSDYAPVVFDAANVINLIYGKNLTTAILKDMYILGAGLKDKTDEEKTAALDAVKIDDKSFADFADKLVEALNTFSAKDTALKTADENLSKATDENKESLQTAYNTAKTAFDEAKKTRDDLIGKLIGVVGESTIVKGYEAIKYDELQETYNAEMKEKVAKAIYKVIMDNVVVENAPKKAVDEAYDMLINTYKYSFYNDTVTDSNGSALKDDEGNSVTNYTYYMSGKYIEKGSFKVFLKDQIAADKDISNGATIETYDDAVSALRKYAESTVVPVVKFTFVAKDLGLEYTDKDFKEYKKTTDSYKTMVEYYGESQIRNGQQFEKLMKELMKAEDVKDGNYVGYKYENELVKVTIK